MVVLPKDAVAFTERAMDSFNEGFPTAAAAFYRAPRPSMSSDALHSATSSGKGSPTYESPKANTHSLYPAAEGEEQNMAPTTTRSATPSKRVVGVKEEELAELYNDNLRLREEAAKLTQQIARLEESQQEQQAEVQALKRAAGILEGNDGGDMQAIKTALGLQGAAGGVDDEVAELREQVRQLTEERDGIEMMLLKEQMKDQMPMAEVSNLDEAQRHIRELEAELEAMIEHSEVLQKLVTEKQQEALRTAEHVHELEERVADLEAERMDADRQTLEAELERLRTELAKSEAVRFQAHQQAVQEATGGQLASVIKERNELQERVTELEGQLERAKYLIEGEFPNGGSVWANGNKPEKSAWKSRSGGTAPVVEDSTARELFPTAFSPTASSEGFAGSPQRWGSEKGGNENWGIQKLLELGEAALSPGVRARPPPWSPQSVGGKSYSPSRRAWSDAGDFNIEEPGQLRTVLLEARRELAEAEGRAKEATKLAEAAAEREQQLQERLSRVEEELGEEKQRAKEVMEELEQELVDVRFHLTDLLEQEHEKRAAVEASSVRRVEELEGQAAEAHRLAMEAKARTREAEEQAERKEAEAAAALAKVQPLEAQVAELEAQVAAAEKELEAAKEREAAPKEEVEVLKSRVQKLVLERDQASSQATHLQRCLDEAESTGGRLSTRLEKVEGELIELREEQEASLAEQASLRETLAAAQAEREAAIATLGKFEAEAQGVVLRLEGVTQRLSQQFEVSQCELSEASTARDRLAQVVVELSQELEMVKGEGSRDVNERLTALSAELEEVKEQREGLVKEAEEVKGQLEEVTKDKEMVARQLEEVNREFIMAKEVKDGVVKRLEGVSAELESTRAESGALRRQVEEASARLGSRLSATEASLAEARGRAERAEATEEKLRALEAELAELRSRRRDLDAELEAVQAERVRAEEQVAQLTAALREAEEKHRQEVTAGKMREGSLASIIEALRQEVEAGRGRQSELEAARSAQSRSMADLAAVQKTSAQLQQRVTDLEDLLAQAGESHAVQEAEIQRLRREVDEACSAAELVLKELERVQGDLEAQQQRGAELADKLRAAEGRVAELEKAGVGGAASGGGKESALEAEVAELRGALEVWQQRGASMQASFRTLQEERDQAEERVAQVQEQLKAVERRMREEMERERRTHEEEMATQKQAEAFLNRQLQGLEGVEAEKEAMEEKIEKYKARYAAVVEERDQIFAQLEEARRGRRW